METNEFFEHIESVECVEELQEIMNSCSKRMVELFDEKV